MWQYHKSYIQSDLPINSTLHSYKIEFVFTITFIESKMIVFSNSYEFNMWQNIDLGQKMHTICCIWYAVHELINASSPSWIFEALVPVPKVVGDVLVYVHGQVVTAFVIGEQTSEIQSRSLRMETRNLKIQDGEESSPRTAEFHVLRKPAGTLNIFIGHKWPWPSIETCLQVILNM